MPFKKYTNYKKSYSKNPSYKKSYYGYKKNYKKNSRPLTNYKSVSAALHTDRSLYGSPFPAIFETTNSYVGTINLTAALGGYSTWAVRGNSVYDPDQTYTGTTALGYTALSSIYTYYMVKYSTIKVKCINQVTGAPVICTLIPAVASNIYNSVIQAKSVPYFKEITLEGKDSGGAIKTMMSTAWSHKICDLDYKDDNFQSAMAANPARQWFWIIGFQALDASSNAGITVDYEIFYRTRWTNRKQLQS